MTPPTALEGFCFRATKGPGDADALYAVRAACSAEDQVDLKSDAEGLPSREEISAGLAEIVTSQRQDQCLVAQMSDRVVGYSRVESWHEDDGRWVYLILGWVLPEWRGRGIGSAMLDWGEWRARSLAAAQHPGERFEFAANSSSTMPASTRLLLDHGYYVGYTVLDLQLDLAARQPPQPLPAGIEVRPARREQYALIATSMNESYRDEYPNNRFRETWDIDVSIAGLCAPRQDPTLWQVAWAGDRVVANVIPLIEKGRAAIYNVCTHPSFRRKGVARALLTRALQTLHERRVQVIRIHTVAEFPTRASELYHSVGFRVMKEFPRYRKSA